MSAPVIWIILPGLAAVALFFLRRWYRASVLAGVLLCLALSAAARWLPIGRLATLGPWNIQLVDTLSLLGRRFVLEDGDRSILTLVYMLAAFWFGASYVTRAGRMFVPLGMGMVVALIAALAVEPFLYAALLIEVAALLSVPILSAPGKPIQRGVLRFLAFNTFGMPFFLFIGWMLGGAETSPGNLDLVVRAAGLLGFGFLFWLAVFPFHTWVPMIVEQARPYAAAFILIILPWMVTLFGLELLDRYAWLRANPGLPILLQRIGALMCLTAGIGIAFERHLGRGLGYAVLAETGFSVLALGLPNGLSLYAVMIVPRILAFGIWALALSLLQAKYPRLQFRFIQGAARQMPIASTALLIAQFSLAGMPLLASFPIRLALLESAATQSVWIASLTLLAMAGLLVASLRTLAVLVMGKDELPWQVTEVWPANFLLVAGMLALVFIGLFPQFILPPLTSILQSFVHLSP